MLARRLLLIADKCWQAGGRGSQIKHATRIQTSQVRTLHQADECYNGLPRSADRWSKNGRSRFEDPRMARLFVCVFHRKIVVLHGHPPPNPAHTRTWRGKNCSAKSQKLIFGGVSDEGTFYMSVNPTWLWMKQTSQVDFEDQNFSRQKSHFFFF